VAAKAFTAPGVPPQPWPPKASRRPSPSR